MRLVIRSAQEQLNRLLADQLGNLVAFEPHEFSARAFAVASLADATRARFDLKGSTVRVMTHVVEVGDWGDGRTPSDLNGPNRRIVGHVAQGRSLGDLFDLRSWDTRIQPGDELVFVECGELLRDARNLRRKEKKKKRLDWRALAERARQGLRAAPKAALASLLIVLLLAALGIVLYRAENPDLSWFDAINVTTVLAVGGFDNVFGSLKAPFPISPGLYAYSLLMKIVSAIFLGIVFATMTERILGARFQIATRRPAAPIEGHTIIVGMGPIGQNVAALLQRWGRPVVGVSDEPVAENILRGLPIKSGPIADALERANIASARSVVVVGDDQVANLETTLLARSLNPRCALVFRVADRDLATSVAALIPDSTGISELEIAAQAITGAAFDETILTAFHLPGRSILVTEYVVTPGDTLIDRQLAHLAYGYGAIPVFHERAQESGATGRINPSDDIRLERGDKVVVLATVDALRRIEHGELTPPRWRLVVELLPFLRLGFRGRQHYRANRELRSGGRPQGAGEPPGRTGGAGLPAAGDSAGPRTRQAQGGRASGRGRNPGGPIMTFPLYVFDAYGTLFDVHSAVARCRDLAGPQAERLSELWRTKQLEYTWTRTLMGAYRDFDALTGDALDFAAARCGGLSTEARAALLQAYETLDAYPDAAPALKLLRAGGAKTVILSNGTPKALARAVASAGLQDLLDESLSADALGRYKTTPEVYELVGARYRVAPEQVSFQSSNRWDVAGATKFGFQAVWINRAGAPDEYRDLAPARVLSTLAEL